MPSSRARKARARQSAAAGRRRVGLAAVGVVALGAAGLAAWTLRPESAGTPASESERPRPTDTRTGSAPIDRHGDLAIASEPAAYRITYRVETFAGGERTVTRDDVSIRRPFDGRTVKVGGSEQAAALGRLYVPSTKESQATLLETGPALAPSDVRLAPVLPDLLEAGRVERREWRRVLGADCQVLRFGGPISSGTPAAALDAAVEYADACVSEEGLVLEELWVLDGRVQRRRLATALQVGEALVPTDLLPPSGLPEPVPVDDGGGSFRPVDPASSYAAPFWVADAAPLPEHAGRWAVVAPAATEKDDEEAKAKRLGYVADVWRDGIDVVVVEQGSTAGGVRPFELGDGPRVTVDGLGEGEVVLDLRMSELHFVREGGYFLRVRGTVGAARLEEIARALRETPGGTGLVYLDGR